MQPSAPTIATSMINLLHKACESSVVPKVIDLHLPPIPWNGSKEGEFCALELDDGSLGLAYVLLDDTLPGLAEASWLSSLAGTDALDLAQWWSSTDPLRSTIGFAAINALSRFLFNRSGFIPTTATDSIAGLDPQQGEHIGMVGLFRPLLKQASANGATLTVLELNADLPDTIDGARITLDVSDLVGCSKILCTSTVLLNDSLDNILAHCKTAQAIALVGPGASCLPDPLFARGVTHLGGVWIENAEQFKHALCAGESWGNSVKKVIVSSSDYPSDLFRQ